MADRSLSFNVAAIDRASKAFEKIALRIDRLELKLDRLDAKRVDVDVDVDTHRGISRIRQFGRRVNRISESISRGIVRAGSDGVRAFGVALQKLPPQVQAVVIGGLVAALVAASTVAGSIAASALVLAFGAGLAILPTIVAAHNKKVRKSFSKLADHVKPIAKDISQPFVPALQHVAKVAQDVFDSFAPTLRKSFADLAPDLSIFADNLGDAFKAFKPAIKPITDAFGDILGAIGPKLPGLFSAMADAFSDLSDTVSKHKELFATVFVGLLHAIPIAIRIINSLAKQFAALVEGVRITGVVAAEAFTIVIKAAQFMADAVLSFLGLIVHGAAKAFGWIPGLGPKLKTAASKFDSFKKGVDGTFNKLISKTQGFKRSLDRLPKVAKIRGNIQDLQQKIRKAKIRLKDPDLTRPEKSKIRANIRDLERKVRRAKARLRSIKGKTVTVHVHTVYTSSGNRYNKHVSIGGRPYGRYASGGLLRGPGTGTSDSMLIRGSTGEYMVRAAAVRSVGTKFLDAVNRQGGGTPASSRVGGHANGGSVSGGFATQATINGPVTLEVDGQQFGAYIRSQQDEGDRSKVRRVLAGSGRRAA